MHPPSPSRRRCIAAETSEKLGGVYLLGLALLAGFLAGKICFKVSASAPSRVAEPATTPNPEINNLRHKLEAGHAPDFVVVTEFAHKASAAADSFGHRASAWLHGLIDGVRGPAWEAQLWLASKGGLRGAASAVAAGGVALARSSPVHLGHNALHAAAAAGLATRLAWPAANLVITAPWVLAAVSLCAALHSLGVIGTLAVQADEAEPLGNAVPPPFEHKTSASQIILSLQVGMAIGAGGAIFMVWVAGQKRDKWLWTTSWFSRPKEGRMPEAREDAESWSIFSVSKSAEIHMRPKFGDDDADSLSSSHKRDLHRTVRGQTLVDTNCSFSGSSRELFRHVTA